MKIEKLEDVCKMLKEIVPDITPEMAMALTNIIVKSYNTGYDQGYLAGQTEDIPTITFSE